MSSRLPITLVSLAALGASAAPAAADSAPVVVEAPPPRPGLTLAPGKLNLALNVELNTSSDAVLEPLSIAPDIAYGVSRDVTVMLVHGSFLATGFRGAAGRGLCLAGTRHGCPHVYDGVGGEVLYSLARGPLAAAASGGLYALSFDAEFYDVKLGAKVRYKTGAVSVTTAPSAYVAITHRKGDSMTTVENLDRIWVPVLVGYDVTRPFFAGLGTGVKGPLSGFGDAWELAVGGVATYQLDPTMTVGASLIFGKIAGGADTTGPDYRWVQVWWSRTFL